jgi:L-asparaginase
MNNTPPSIHYIMTGGTIDSYYDPTQDTAIPNKESIIPTFIKSLRLYSESEFTVVCMKDSRNFQREDLQLLLKTIEDSLHTKIIVTHGTYTIADTARFLQANLLRDDQTIILTASFIPITGFTPSDGPFNLGYAVAQAEHLPSGMYVCMNGRVFEPQEIMKVIEEGRFYSIFQKKEASEK